MSNPDAAPDELTCGTEPSTSGGQLIEPRAVPLGGPRAMTVRRTLPQRARSLIGAWCFADAGRANLTGHHLLAATRSRDHAPGTAHGDGAGGPGLRARRARRHREVVIGGLRAGPGRLVYRPPGSSDLELLAGTEQARVLVLGGEPLAEQIVMWWNVIGRSHEEIVEFRARWMDERPRPDCPGGERRPYGTFPSSWAETLPAPDLPHARLTPRR